MGELTSLSTRWRRPDIHHLRAEIRRPRKAELPCPEAKGKVTLRSQAHPHPTCTTGQSPATPTCTCPTPQANGRGGSREGADPISAIFSWERERWEREREKGREGPPRLVPPAPPPPHLLHVLTSKCFYLIFFKVGSHCTRLKGKSVCLSNETPSWQPHPPWRQPLVGLCWVRSDGQSEWGCLGMLDTRVEQSERGGTWGQATMHPPPSINTTEHTL